MKITSKICKALKIHNQWDYANPSGYAGEHHPYLYYNAADNGRDGYSAAWNVSQHGKSFSDFWRDYGSCRFSVYRREEKESKFQDAVEWMCNKFGFTKENIIKTPMGSWMNKEFVDKRNKEIEVLYKQLQASSDTSVAGDK